MALLLLRRKKDRVKIIAIDPGVTTGLATYDTETEEFRATEETDWLNVADLVATGEIHHVVCESFQLTTSTTKKSTAGSIATIELTGVIRWLAHKRGIELVFQSAVDKEFTSAEKLRRLGWWTVGSDHARSATKHLVLHLVKTGCLDPRRLVQSSEGGEA